MQLNITASSYAHAGLSVIPTLADKRPACAWKQFTERIMSEGEIEAMFVSPSSEAKSKNGTDNLASTSNSDFSRGIGIVCGRVSGNLELLDFDDGGSAFGPWKASVPAEIMSRLVVERSPSGGKHVYYRVGSPSLEAKTKSGTGKTGLTCFPTC